MLANAIGHIATTARFRRYNPGLLTSVVLFVPLSVATLRVVSADVVAHLLGLAIALAIHAAIIVNVRRRLVVSPR